MNVLWGIAIGALLLVLVCVVMVTALGRSGRAAARREGALWGGLAQLDVDEARDVPQVAAAVSGVGRLFGGRRGARSVGGVLVVTRDELRWEPRLWLGRGSAQGWELPVRDLRGWELHRPAGALVGHELRLAVVGGGTVRLQVADEETLRAALERACGCDGQTLRHDAKE